MSSLTHISISDNFPIWLGAQLKENVTAKNIETVAQRVFSSFPNHLKTLSESDKIFSVRLKQSIAFLDMFQSPDEKNFIERIKTLTPHKSIFEALPTLHLMVIIKTVFLYPPQVGQAALLEILGSHDIEFFSLELLLLANNLDTISQNTLEILYTLSQNQALVLELCKWVNGQRLFSLLDTIPQLTPLLDEIPSNLSPYTLEGYKASLQFLREKLHQATRQIDEITEIHLQDTNDQNVIVEGIPKEISLFHHLKKLCINSKDIHTLPTSLAQCQKLEEIHFQCAASNCYLPSELGSLPNLKTLITSSTVLLPEELQKKRSFPPS